MTTPALDRGELLLQLGKPAAALDAAREAVAAAPDDPAALTLLAQALAGTGDLAAAEQAARAAVAKAPADGWVWLVLGGVLNHRGRSAEALSVLRGAVRLDPGNPTAHEQLALALHERNDIQGALDAAAVGLDAHPQDMWLLYRRGLAQADQGRGIDALATAGRAIALHPTAGPLWHLKGRALKASDAADAEVIAAFREAVRLDPSDPVPRRALRRAEFAARQTPGLVAVILAPAFAMLVGVSLDGRAKGVGLGLTAGAAAGMVLAGWLPHRRVGWAVAFGLLAAVVVAGWVNHESGAG